MFFKGDQLKSLEYIDKALWLSPKNPEALREKMIVLYSLERFSDTIIVSDILIKVYPRNSVGWAFKGFALAKLGENKKALKCLNKATKLNHNDFQTLYEKTKLLIKMKKYKDALKSYKRLIELDHENADLWLKVGNLFFSLKGYWGALKCYDNAIILKMEEKVSKKFCRVIL